MLEFGYWGQLNWEFLGFLLSRSSHDQRGLAIFWRGGGANWTTFGSVFKLDTHIRLSVCLFFLLHFCIVGHKTGTLFFISFLHTAPRLRGKLLELGHLGQGKGRTHPMTRAKVRKIQALVWAGVRQDWFLVLSLVPLGNKGKGLGARSSCFAWLFYIS